MAGTVSVAKVVYLNNLFGDASSYGIPSGSMVGNMEEDDVVNLLNSTDYEERTEILETLRSLLRRNGGRLPYVDQKAIFRGLSSALTDSNWDVRHYCLQLIHELIPQFGDDLDDCMSVVLPRIVSNMGHGKVAVRRDVIQTLHVYMKHTKDVQQLLRGIVRYGLENVDSRIKKEVVVGLPMLFTPDFSREDFFEITRSLAKRLLDDTEENLQQHVLLSMKKIHNLVGDASFNTYLQNIPSSLRGYYYKLSNQKATIALQASTFPKQNVHGLGNEQQHPRIQYDFGVVPGQVMMKLNDQSNFRTRAQGVEELKDIIKNLRDVSDLHPHLINFISFLNNLLDDSNFKIITVTLEIVGSLVDAMSVDIQACLKPVVMTMTKRMDDNKIVVRQAIMKVLMQLMHLLSPKPILSLICENLAHRNSRVRQETLNVVIASLLTFPSYEFDLPLLCQRIAHTLVDSKRQVRQAALECLAVLAQAMGAGKLQALVHAVDGVELSCEGDGVMAAVQARLARRQLPRLNADRLVDYTTPVPTSASVHAGLGADVEWVLSAAGGASARSHRSGDMELESVTSARSTPTGGPHDSGSSRRHFSAGKGKSRLPWDDGQDGCERNGSEATARQVSGPPSPTQVSGPPSSTQVSGPPLSQTDQWTPLPHTGQWTPLLHTGQWTPLLHTGQWTPPLHTVQWTPLPHTGQWTPLLHTGQWTPLLHTGQWTPLLRKGQWTPLLHTGQWTPPLPDRPVATLPQQGQLTTLLYTGQWTPLPHTGQWTPLPHTGQWTPLPHTGQWTPLLYTGQWTLSPPPSHRSVDPTSPRQTSGPPPLHRSVDPPSPSRSVDPLLHTGQWTPLPHTGQLTPLPQTDQWPPSPTQVSGPPSLRQVSGPPSLRQVS